MSDVIDESVAELITKETAITQANAKMARFAYTEEAYTADTVAGVSDYSYSQEQNIPLGSSSVLETNATVLDKGVRSQASSLPRMVVNHFFGRASYNLNKIHDRFLAFLNTFKKHLAQDNNLYSATRVYTEGDVCFILYTFTDSSGADRKSLRMFRAIYADGTFSNQSPLIDDEVNTTYWSECDYLSSFGKPNGVATLDSDGRLPYSQLPESSIEYKGNWDASTNTPALADGTGTNGDFYIVSVAGTQDLGSGSIMFLENDRVIYDGATGVWEKLSGGAVKTVNAKSPDSQGNVSLTGADINVSASCTTKVNTLLEEAVTEVNGNCVASGCHSVTLTGDDIEVSGSVTDTLGCVASLTGTVADITNANTATGTASLALGITSLVTTRGDLSALCTTCKDSLVVAMNELYDLIASSGGTPLAYFTNCYGTSCCGMSGNACGNVILANGVAVSTYDKNSILIGVKPNTCSHTSSSNSNIALAINGGVFDGANNAILLGSYSCVAHCAIAIGRLAKACSESSIAIGNCTCVCGVCSVALGYGNSLTGTTSIAIGMDLFTCCSASINIGSSNCICSSYSMAMGLGNKTIGSWSTAIGSYAESTGICSIAIGNYVCSCCSNSIAIGRKSTANSANSVAIGNNVSTYVAIFGTATICVTTAVGNIISGCITGTVMSQCDIFNALKTLGLSNGTYMMVGHFCSCCNCTSCSNFTSCLCVESSKMWVYKELAPFVCFCCSSNNLVACSCFPFTIFK